MTLACPCCAAPAHIIYADFPGYVEPSRFDIARCFACDTNLALVEGVDLSAFYDRIYGHQATLRGYGRYVRYADDVAHAPDPLGFLADKELNFWALREALRTAPRGARVLDVGSGLGYLTYALNRAGYAATGLDISPEAVRRAKTQFGDFYAADDLFEHARKNPLSYDVVILCAVIAHVPNIAAFFDACLSLTRPGGKVIVVTPNKARYASHLVWSLDPPPALLYWLSSASLAALGRRSGVECELADLSLHPGAERWRREIPIRFATCTPILDSRGNLLPRHRSLRARLANSLRKRLEKEDAQQTAAPDHKAAPSCAVFTKGEP